MHRQQRLGKTQCIYTIGGITTTWYPSVFFLNLLKECHLCLTYVIFQNEQRNTKNSYCYFYIYESATVPIQKPFLHVLQLGFCVFGVYFCSKLGGVLWSLFWTRNSEFVTASFLWYPKLGVGVRIQQKRQHNYRHIFVPQSIFTMTDSLINKRRPEEV